MKLPFSGVSRTLLVPLVARALSEELNPDLDFRDPAAKEALGRLDVDPRPLSRDRASMRGAVVRARLIDRLAEVWFSHHPDGLGVSLGGGLDHRFRRIDNRRLRWVDLDLPDVVRFRRSLWPEQQRCRLVAGSLTDPAWIETIGARPGEPLLVVVEGVLMYLSRDQVRAFFQEAAARLPAGSTIIFDAGHWLGQRLRFTPGSVRSLGERFHWGFRRPAEVLAWAPALTLGQQLSVLDGMSTPYRLLGRSFSRITRGEQAYSVVELHVSGRPSASPSRT